MSRTSLASKLTQGAIITTFTSIAGFFVWTKHCDVQPLNPATEPLYRSAFYHKYNPHNNFSNADVITRRIPLHQVRPDLLEDAREGGSRLVEHFCGSIFGGGAYTVQRLIHGRNKPESSIPPLEPSLEDSTPILNEVADATKSTWSRLSSVFSGATSNTASTPSPSSSTITTTTPKSPPEDLWSPTALQSSPYTTNTVITNHFLVLSRQPPHTILLRCGDSPLTSPSTPRSSDGLFQLSAVANFEKGYAEFQLKSVFYNGTEENKGAKEGMSGRMWWLHQQYGKLWMEWGVGGCKLKRWRSEEAQKRVLREEGLLKEK